MGLMHESRIGLTPLGVNVLDTIVAGFPVCGGVAISRCCGWTLRIGSAPLEPEIPHAMPKLHTAPLEVGDRPLRRPRGKAIGLIDSSSLFASRHSRIHSA